MPRADANASVAISTDTPENAEVAIVQPMDNAQGDCRASNFSVRETNELLACVAKVYEKTKHTKSKQSKQALWDSAFDDYNIKQAQRTKKSLQVIKKHIVSCSCQ